MTDYHSAEAQEILSSLVGELSFWDRSPHPQRGAKTVSLEGQQQKLPQQHKPTLVTAKGSNDSLSSMSHSESEPQKPVWRTAVDPATGRTYYYDAITRRTQWEKPEEIRQEERKARKEKRRQDRVFFEEMERNLLASLAKGEIIPGCHREQVQASGPPKEPLPLDKPVLKVRTISAMNERLLAELSGIEGGNWPHSTTSSSAAHSVSSSSQVHSTRSSSPAPGRPPLPSRRPHPVESQESLELSPDTSSVAKSTTTGVDTETDSLRGEHLLDGPILMESECEEKSTKDALERPQALSSHVRRNTGGTIYLKSTMEHPDINATIKCVCGVYRAHIVQASKQQHRPQPAACTANVNLDLFRDDYETKRKLSSDLPSLANIELFYHDFYRRSQMEHDTIIMSLIYVERLIKQSNGALAPTPYNWRSVLFSCMVLSSKVWDDLSMFNLDFSNVSMASGLSSFSLQRTNALELAVLTILNFDVRVPASEYAKYYFLIRTMLIRSGLSDGDILPLSKSRDEAKLLEFRTSQYQDTKLEGQRERRTRSVDWSNLFAQPRESEPVLRDTLCLEQIVSMDR